MSVFVIKPIILTLIRWISFIYIYIKEISITKTSKNDLAHDKVEDLSKNIFSELDDLDKESKEDFQKIERIIDYQEKRKKEE